MDRATTRSCESHESSAKKIEIRLNYVWKSRELIMIAIKFLSSLDPSNLIGKNDFTSSVWSLQNGTAGTTHFRDFLEGQSTICMQISVNL